MMKLGTLVCLFLAICLPQSEAQLYSRLKQLFPSFDDLENIPSDFQLQDDGLGYVDVDPTVDVDGIDLPVDGLNYRMFDKVIRFLRCYDTGYCVCDSDNAITRTVTLDTDPPGDAATGTYFETDLCLIAPNWVKAASSGMEYRMAHRHVDRTNSFQQHDIALIRAAVTRANNWWPQSWSAVSAEIITWIITDSASGSMDKFQVVLTLGDDGKTYVLFLYETVGSFPATTPVRGFLNGQYGDIADVMSARICPSTAGSDAMPSNDDLMKKSNLKCGRPGFYLFTTEDGDACLGTTPCATYEHDSNRNCNQSNIPKDSCTESFSCSIDADNNIKLDITLQWYKWKSLRALDYETYIGTGSETEPDCVQVWAGTDDKCWKKDLPHPGENDPTVATYTLMMAEDTPECGTVIDPAAKSVKFVYKNYNYDPAVHVTDIYDNVDQDGDVIIYGTCYYSDLPRVVTQSVMFNDFSAPTQMPPRDRSVEMHIVDRDTASGLVLTRVKVGRDYYLRICFYPGTPFTRNADPFGCYATECIAANNEMFDNVPASWERSLTFIFNSCPITTPTEPLKLTRGFQADLGYSSYDGDGWCILTGKIDAANWFTLNAGVPVTKLFFKCYVEFCHKQDGVGFGQGFEQQKCIDNCEADNTKRRRRSNGQGVEAVYTSVELIYPNDTATDTKTEPHADSESPTIVIIIIVIAVVMVMVAIGICILVYWKLRAMKIKQQTMKSSKERLYEVDQWSNMPIKY